MCKWGTETLMEVTIPAHLSHSGEAYRKTVGIDSCIAPLVKTLNDAGFATVASCCGHGNRPGRISLADGRELMIVPNYETAGAIDTLFPNDIYGGPTPNAAFAATANSKTCPHGRFLWMGCTVCKFAPQPREGVTAPVSGGTGVPSVQSVSFTVTHIWDAYKAGAKETREIMQNGLWVTDETIGGACDAYCKLTYDAHGGDIYAVSGGTGVPRDKRLDRLIQELIRSTIAYCYADDGDEEALADADRNAAADAIQNHVYAIRPRAGDLPVGGYFKEQVPGIRSYIESTVNGATENSTENQSEDANGSSVQGIGNGNSERSGPQHSADGSDGRDAERRDNSGRVELHGDGFGAADRNEVHPAPDADHIAPTRRCGCVGRCEGHPAPARTAIDAARTGTAAQPSEVQS